jgi:hypothetical protein
MHPLGHFSSMKRVDFAAKKGPRNLYVRQSSLQHSPNDHPQGGGGVGPEEVRLSHTVPLVELGDGMATHERGERRISIIPQKEPYPPPPN